MVTVEQTSNNCLALNNVPETVKHLVDQRLLSGNFAELSQVFWKTLVFLAGYPVGKLAPG